MIKVRNAIIFGWLLAAVSLNAQTLTIEDCFKKARANYPLIKQFDLIEQSKTYNLSAANKNWLPQVLLSGKASWQSDITEFPESIMSMWSAMGVTGIAFPKKDQYNVALNLSQTLWDGGITAQQKKMATINAETGKVQTEISLYALYSQINQLFFNILSINEQLKQNQLFIEELERNHKKIERYIENGIALRSDLDNVKVGIVEAKQRVTEMKSYQKTGLLVLGAFIGEEIRNPEDLTAPQPIKALSGIENRPEIKLFSAQSKLFETQSSMLYTKGMPRIALFATGAFANPGLNMFKTGFTPYFIGGINLSWNFSGLYSMRDEKRNLAVQQKNSEVQKEIFLFNTNQKIVQQNADVEKLNELLKQDDEIIELRTRIKNSSTVKVENGTMTVSEYLREVTNENIARQTKALREISLLQTIFQLRIENGELTIND